MSDNEAMFYWNFQTETQASNHVSHSQVIITAAVAYYTTIYCLKYTSKFYSEVVSALRFLTFSDFQDKFNSITWTSEDYSILYDKILLKSWLVSKR